MQQKLPNTKKLTFLKQLLINSHYRNKQKSEEFFCELFSVLVTQPLYMNIISQSAPNAFSVFSRHIDFMVNRMTFLRRENLNVPSLSDLLTDELGVKQHSVVKRP